MKMLRERCKACRNKYAKPQGWYGVHIQHFDKEGWISCPDKFKKGQPPIRRGNRTVMVRTQVDEPCPIWCIAHSYVLILEEW